MKHGPVCTTVLELAHRDGIEIDYCSRCRGVWLDRGELEKVIERTSSYARSDDDDNDEYDQNRQRSGEGTHGYGPQTGPPPAGDSPPKKEGFFSRLFDFD